MESVLPVCVCSSHAVEPEVAITAVGICPGAMHGGEGGRRRRQRAAGGEALNVRVCSGLSQVATALSDP